MFVDRIRVELVAGNGGNGISSFRREKYVARGGPDGGDGGRGGSIILEAKVGVDSLAGLSHKKQWRADHGKAGGPHNRQGRSAKDVTLLVPPGTIVVDQSTGLQIKDLARPGEKIVVAKGGAGGRGNVHFKSSVNRAPRESTAGEVGVSRQVILELKVIADVGLVGLPNAGKSTLLSRLSHARPEIANYAFTTKSPVLGIVEVSPEQSFVLADLPGLIEGAHAGVGLGHEFLRHVERAGILVHVVEPAPLDGSDPLTNYQKIRQELSLYDESLGARPEILIVSKSELVEAKAVREELSSETGLHVIAVSAVTGDGLPQLLRSITKSLRAPMAVIRRKARWKDSVMSADVSTEEVDRTSNVLLADVGNSRIKLALVSGVSRGMPLLERRYELDSRGFSYDDFESWLMAVVSPSTKFFIASVCDAAAAQLETAISSISGTRQLLVQLHQVHFSDLPLRVKAEQPDRVGIDRLAAATAASHLVSSNNGCIIIDCGTAATVDMVGSEGQFLGGAILPGPALLARCLADGTSLLPEVSSLGHASPPPMPGRSTNNAIAAGVGFGIRGAVCRLVDEARRELGSEAEILLTGGWRGIVRGEFSNVREFPDLVLSGIGIAAMRISGL